MMLAHMLNTRQPCPDASGGQPPDALSAAFFMEATYEVIIDPRDIPECCPPGQPPMYPPISSGDYLVQKYRETHASFEGPPGSAVDQPVNGHAALEGPKTAVDKPANGHASFEGPPESAVDTPANGHASKA